ncbi:protein disulfide-isomerase 5-2 [Dorcoceras hygrometricum]|uniref:Protein disulfide-isomerase 5-2 n=1 Tax=Dorcoceras hygrometricum TaxID=472368 RepID=A0A2Z7B030_9LAMI|nr:protein disulfide-isomerase 5-2 [Dorcoceras hygrometricum]
MAEKLLKNYIKQKFFPLVLPVNEETRSCWSMAASEIRDLIFGFVGFKQWEDFAESFDVSKKTKLPKMVCYGIAMRNIIW